MFRCISPLISCLFSIVMVILPLLEDRMIYLPIICYALRFYCWLKNISVIVFLASKVPAHFVMLWLNISESFGRFYISNNYMWSTISLVQSADRTSVNVSLPWRTSVTPILFKNEDKTSVNVSLKRRTSVTRIVQKWRQNFGKCLIKLENFGDSYIVKKWRQNFGICLVKTETFGNSYFVVIEDNFGKCLIKMENFGNSYLVHSLPDVSFVFNWLFGMVCVSLQINDHIMPNLSEGIYATMEEAFSPHRFVPLITNVLGVSNYSTLDTLKDSRTHKAWCDTLAWPPLWLVVSIELAIYL